MTASKILTDKRYFGKVCNKHPDYEGLRRKSCYRCVACLADRTTEYLKTEVAAKAKKSYDSSRRDRTYGLRKSPEQMEKKLFHNRMRLGLVNGAANKDYGWWDSTIKECIYSIAKIYRDNGIHMVVDHIIPLNGKDVCGLHVGCDLQVVTFEYNTLKSNLT